MAACQNQNSKLHQNKNHPIATCLPTVGVAKNLHLIEDLGLEGERGEAARRLKESFKGVQAVGHQVPLVTQKGRVLGAAVKTSLESKNPIFVSVGSGLSLKTAVSLVTAMSRYFLNKSHFWMVNRSTWL